MAMRPYRPNHHDQMHPPARNGNRTVPNRPALMRVLVMPLADGCPVGAHRAHHAQRKGPDQCEVRSGNGKLETRPAPYARDALIPGPSPTGEGSAGRSVERDAKSPSPAGRGVGVRAAARVAMRPKCAPNTNPS